jgi:general secretion pathway protein G
VIISRCDRWLGEKRRALGRPAVGRVSDGHRTLAQSGFTLIELLVVMSLIVILATMGLVQYRQSIVRSKEAVLKEDLFRMRDALDQYYADKNQYPASLDALVTDGYLRRVPKDPFTESEAWQTVQAEPDPANLTTEPGISDIKSASEALAMDGSKYSEW